MRYIKDRPNDFPVLDKGKLKRIQVSIETWESICDLVEFINQIWTSGLQKEMVWFINFARFSRPATTRSN